MAEINSVSLPLITVVFTEKWRNWPLVTPGSLVVAELGISNLVFAKTRRMVKGTNMNLLAVFILCTLQREYTE
jgi:hypothetical protein